MMDKFSAELRQARAVIAIGLRFLHRLFQLDTQRRCRALIRIYREHPMTRCIAQRTIFLRPEARPLGMFIDLRAQPYGNTYRIIRATGIHHDDFIRPQHRL